MARKRARDIQKTYSRSQFVAKLRRLADAIESEAPFTIQIASERLRTHDGWSDPRPGYWTSATECGSFGVPP